MQQLCHGGQVWSMPDTVGAVEVLLVAVGAAVPDATGETAGRVDGDGVMTRVA
jgi:hypothetical protein